MYAYLSEELTKYYRRLDNGWVRFQNGMTLNQLAWYMSQRGSNTHPSNLSLVIRGRRLFTILQLEAFCNVMRLDWQQRDQLIQAYIKDVFAYEGIEVDLSVSDDYLEALEDFSEEIHQVRVQGNPNLAVERIDAKLTQISQKLKKVRSQKKRDYLLQITVQLLLEKAASLSDSEPPEIACTLIRKIGEDVWEIGQQLDNRDQRENLFSLSYLIKGGGYWVIDEYRATRRYLSEGLPLWVSKNYFYKCEFIRLWGLSCAYMSDEQGFKQAENEIKRLEEIQPLDLMTRCLILSFLGRGYGRLGSTDASRFLEDGLMLYATAKHERKRYPLREIQLTISYLEVWRSSKNINRQLVEDLANQALLLATENGYKRHVYYIEDALQKMFS